jgi:NhaP-type Na+/H+ or K+/H+ antiporter
MAFGVVIFTLLVQGTTMGPVVRRLELATRSPEKEKYQRRKGYTLATREAGKRLETLWEDGIISNHTREIIAPILEQQSDELTEEIRNVLKTKPAVAAEELDAAWREVLRVERATLDELFIEGVITEEHFWDLAAPIDTALQKNEITWMELDELKAGLNYVKMDEE